MKVSARMAVVALAAVLALTVAASHPAAAEGFIGGGGFDLRYWAPDVTEVNAALQKAGMPTLSGGMMMYGGGGLGGELKGLRFGGFGTGGDMTATNGDLKSILSFGFGGSTFEYGWPVNDVFTLSTGVALGFGGMDLTTIHGKPGDLQDALKTPVETHLSRFAVVAEPSVAVSARLAPFFVLRLQAGYLAPWFVGSWTTTAGQDLGRDITLKPGPSVALSFVFGASGTGEMPQ